MALEAIETMVVRMFEFGHAEAKRSGRAVLLSHQIQGPQGRLTFHTFHRLERRSTEAETEPTTSLFMAPRPLPLCHGAAEAAPAPPIRSLTARDDFIK